MRFAVILLLVMVRPSAASGLDWIRKEGAGRGFTLEPSGKSFVPWGFNYDHDENGRLLEDYWDSEWKRVEGDFEEMKSLRANVIRVHLQLGRFMEGPKRLNRRSLRRLGRLIALAERHGMYLDITGLGNYRREDIPPWYAALTEQQRWKVQERFWEAVAAVGPASPAIFCYNLMNEPAVPAERRSDWLAEPFIDGRYYVEFITREPGGRTRWEVGREWLRVMTAAVRRKDPRHLISVGSFVIGGQAESLPIGGTPEELAQEVDFISIHLYPEENRRVESLQVLKRLAAASTVVIEEIAPLKCSAPSLATFEKESQAYASGWLGFYWGSS